MPSSYVQSLLVAARALAGVRQHVSDAQIATNSAAVAVVAYDDMMIRVQTLLAALAQADQTTQRLIAEVVEELGRGQEEDT